MTVGVGSVPEALACGEVAEVRLPGTMLLGFRYVSDVSVLGRSFVATFLIATMRFIAFLC